MPRYDYECSECNHRFELRQSFNSEPYATCPKCESTANRKFSPVPVVFKGSGWYVNDYGKRGSSTNSAGSDNHKDSASDSSESKSDSKGEKKAESKTKAESTSNTSSNTSSSSSSKSE